MGTVYLLHFNREFKGCRHYIGYTENLDKRIKAHRSKRGARLVAAVVGEGIKFRVARTWENVDGHFERSLKNRKNSKFLCPICKKREAKRNERHMQ